MFCLVLTVLRETAHTQNLLRNFLLRTVTPKIFPCSDFFKLLLQLGIDQLLPKRQKDCGVTVHVSEIKMY